MRQSCRAVVLSALALGLLATTVVAPADAAEFPRAITGRVTDVNGVGVPGVLVEWGSSGDGPKQRQSVVTGADGRYRLVTSRVGGDFRIGFSKRGFAPSWTGGIIPGPASKPMVLDAMLQPGTSVQVRFTTQAGEPVAGLNLRVATASSGDFKKFGENYSSTPLPGPARDFVTDADGRVTLDDLPDKPNAFGWPPENWLQLNVNYSDRGYYDHQLTTKAVLGKEPIVIQLPDWQLPRSPESLKGVVRGRVVDATTGKPIARYAVTMRFKPEVHAIDDPGSAFSLGGALRIGDDYQVHVFAPGYAVGEKKLRAAAEGDVETQTIEITPHASFKGRLIDAATGKPLAGVTVVAGFYPERTTKYIEWQHLDEYTDGYTGIQNCLRITTDGDGRFTIPEGVDQPVHLFILHAGYERVILTPANRTAAGGDGVALLKVRPAATLTVVAVRETPAGAAAQAVTVYSKTLWAEGFQGFGFTVPLDDNGRATIDSLGAGLYGVTLQLSADHLDAATATKRVTLEAGQHKTILLGTFPGYLRLYGQAPPFAWISVEPKFDADFTNFSVQADVDGNYALTSLLPGKYNLSASANQPGGFRWEAQSKTIELKENMELDLRQ